MFPATSFCDVSQSFVMAFPFATLISYQICKLLSSTFFKSFGFQKFLLSLSAATHIYYHSRFQMSTTFFKKFHISVFFHNLQKRHPELLCTSAFPNAFLLLYILCRRFVYQSGIIRFCRKDYSTSCNAAKSSSPVLTFTTRSTL